MYEPCHYATFGGYESDCLWEEIAGDNMDTWCVPSGGVSNCLLCGRTRLTKHIPSKVVHRLSASGVRRVDAVVGPARDDMAVFWLYEGVRSR